MSNSRWVPEFGELPDETMDTEEEEMRADGDFDRLDELTKIRNDFNRALMREPTSWRYSMD